jgi:hypothetical protein
MPSFGSDFAHPARSEPPMKSNPKAFNTAVTGIFFPNYFLRISSCVPDKV